MQGRVGDRQFGSVQMETGREVWTRNLRVGLGGVIGVLILILILQNMAMVETHLLFWTVAMPRALLLAVTAVGGFVVGLMTGLRLR